MSALLDSFAQAFDALAQREAAGLGDSRRAALETLLRDGLPPPRSEAWKYTPLRALERRGFAPADAGSVDAVALDARLSSIPMPRMVFVDGRFDAARSDVSDLPQGVEALSLSRVLREGEPRDANVLQRRYAGADELFAVANAALAEEGAFIRVDASVVVDVSLHLVFVASGTQADTAAHLRHLIDLRNDAALTVVEHHVALGEDRGLRNHVLHAHVGQRARLVHARVQDDADSASAFVRTDVVLARDADYRRLDLELGAGLSRHELNVRLEGEGAKLAANGVLLADGKRHVDTRLGIEHIARDTSCDLLWRGLAAGRGRAVFHGGITIREGADGTDANLSNKNLLLSANAEIDTQPVLVIHADEVQAAHGATVGQIDPTALFYLRSRGLPEPQARALLTAAFCREVLAIIDDVALRDALTTILDAHLSRVAPE
ncbi:MAG: Fe-S cluster assembly protein SufD [Xanthomonadaceae bacterium]|nr:Fe-S cluster assembly protein SufD [Xanthomonadaceae bacterium]